MLVKKLTLLVLSDPSDRHLAMLDPIRETANVVIGDAVQAFTRDASDADVIFNWSGPLPLMREVFRSCPHLRWIHSRSVGLERTLFPELLTSEVVLTNGSGVFSPSLGEFALGAILYFAKDFRRMIRNQMAGVWEAFDVMPVAGQTVGIVGYGDIGRAVATRARAVGMNVVAVKRHLPPVGHSEPLVDRIFAPSDRLEMLALCDYIVVAAPMNAETRGLIGEAEFAVLKETAVVINLGRGPVIDEGAMLKALVGHKIKGAALDVFDEEPLPKGHPFYSLENVLLSPHCADHTPDWLDNAMAFFLAQFDRFRREEPLLNVVDKELGY
jgi:phosphoglycerate dehydrogenase-like enzyme